MPRPLPKTSVVRPGERLSWEFVLLLRSERDGRPLGRVEVNDADFVDVFTEVWRDAFLRRGFPEAPFEDVVFALAPRLRGAGPRSDGFVIEVENPRGERFRKEYPIDAFRDTALLAAQGLLEEGGLEESRLVRYEVHARPRKETASRTDATGPSFAVTSTNAPVSFLETPLQPLLERARPVGDIDGDVFAVFYTEEALSKTERFARRGGKVHPPVETGCVLIGWLCSCPASGELFAVVCDALEATEAEEGKFSLAYSSKTWSRLQAIVAARRSRRSDRALRILGQGHGHSFPPAGGAPPCAICPTAKVCGRTNVFVSTHDRLWSRAVFHHQPWQLCHIFGLNARGENVDGLFSLQGNRLTERGFHVVPESSALPGLSAPDRGRGIDSGHSEPPVRGTASTNAEESKS